MSTRDRPPAQPGCIAGALLGAVLAAGAAGATDLAAVGDEGIDPEVRAWLLGEQAPRRGRLDLEAGYRIEYDSNVPSGPDNLLVPGIGGDRDDLRHTLFADLVGRYDLGGGWSLFGEVHLNGGLNQDLGQYDHLTHDWVGSVGWSGRRWGFRLPLEFEQTRMDGDRLQDVLSLAPGVVFQASPRLQLYPHLRVERRGFRAVPVPEERRDGNAWFAGLNLSWTSADRKTGLRGIVDYGREDLDGDNWANDRWHLYLRLDRRITGRLTLVLGGEIFSHDFDNLHSTFLVRREDTQVSVFGTLRYALAEHWSLDLSGIVIRNDSNIDLYSFDRHIVSGGITWRY